MKNPSPKKVPSKAKAVDLMLALKSERKRQMELSKKLSEVQEAIDQEHQKHNSSAAS